MIPLPREMIGHILRESVEVAHVVDDILVAARIESGSLHIQCEQIDVRQIADSILDSLPGNLGASRVRIGGFAESWADPVRVRQIVRNLITNALVHGDLVSVDLRNDLGEGRRLHTPRRTRDSRRHPSSTVRALRPDTQGFCHASGGRVGPGGLPGAGQANGGPAHLRREGGYSTFTLELPGASAVRPKEAVR